MTPSTQKEFHLSQHTTLAYGDALEAFLYFWECFNRFGESLMKIDGCPLIELAGGTYEKETVKMLAIEAQLIDNQLMIINGLFNQGMFRSMTDKCKELKIESLATEAEKENN